MVIGGESVPWWRTDHAYLDDVEMLEVGESGGDDQCPAPTNFPDSISAAAAAVMSEYGDIPRLGETQIIQGCASYSSLVKIHPIYSKTRFGCLKTDLFNRWNTPIVCGGYQSEPNRCWMYNNSAWYPSG